MVNNNHIFVVKGISGSGKSSRVFQLLKFFESLGFTLSDFYFENTEGKNKLVGVLVEELSLIFIGKIYKSGDIERWQGYDAMTSSFGKASDFSEFLKSNSLKYSFIVEGAGITQTHRLRPKFLFDEVGYQNITVQYYNYPKEGKEDYYNRIIYRSGEKPKKDVMWDKNLGFISDSEFSEKEFSLLGANNDKVNIFVNEFEEPIYDFGEKLLAIFGLEDSCDDFICFTESFDYINKNKFENFQ